MKNLVVFDIYNKNIVCDIVNSSFEYYKIGE